jgi:two-component system sensor histidine kinase QseC
VFEADTTRWSCLWARTPIEGMWLLSQLALGVIRNLLIALPCVVLPVWLATARGLAPLRRFSVMLAARGPGDLSPVGMTVRHAELIPIAAALDQLLGRLRHRMAAEQSFVTNAAHELRTPLAVVAAQSHVLARAEHAAQRIEAQGQLQAAIARASHLIQQLLVLARMDTERSPRRTAQDIAQLVRQQMACFVPAASARGIELSLEAPDRLIFPVEVESFQSVLQNLLDNAVRYGTDGGSVMVTLNANGSDVTLAVTDDGPGIPEAERSRVFDRFYRLDRGSNVSGTGLGLAIVKQALARLPGEVRLGEGMDGRGSCFTVVIRSQTGGGPSDDRAHLARQRRLARTAPAAGGQPPVDG